MQKRGVMAILSLVLSGEKRIIASTINAWGVWFLGIAMRVFIKYKPYSIKYKPYLTKYKPYFMK